MSEKKFNGLLSFLNSAPKDQENKLEGLLNKYSPNAEAWKLIAVRKFTAMRQNFLKEDSNENPEQANSRRTYIIAETIIKEVIIENIPSSRFLKIGEPAIFLANIGVVLKRSGLEKIQNTLAKKISQKISDSDQSKANLDKKSVSLQIAQIFRYATLYDSSIEQNYDPTNFSSNLQVNPAQAVTKPLDSRKVQ